MSFDFIVAGSIEERTKVELVKSESSEEARCLGSFPVLKLVAAALRVTAKMTPWTKNDEAKSHHATTNRRHF